MSPAMSCMEDQEHTKAKKQFIFLCSPIRSLEIYRNKLNEQKWVTFEIELI